MAEKAGLGTPLHNPPDAKVDIVFVHGLGGDRISTWTSKPTDDLPQKTFWPQELLPKACPTARILSFGYDSRFISFFPFITGKSLAQEATVDEYSAALYQSLANLRETTNTPSDRPIIYVAHSLGGLVVASALSRPYGADEAAKKLTNNVVGLIFLGTPFAGSDKAPWGKIGLKIASLVGMTKGSDVKDLEERSERLVHINRDFDVFIKGRDRDHGLRKVEIVCYFEEFPTYVRGKDIDKIVKKESAARLPAVTTLEIPANHSNMCKFAAEFVSGYVSVSGQLVQWIKQLEKKSDEDAEKPVRVQINGVVDNKGVVVGTISAQPGGVNKITGQIGTNIDMGSAFQGNPDFLAKIISAGRSNGN